MYYLNDNWKETLDFMGLATFDDWWEFKGQQAESPNTKKGNPNAWSFVTIVQTPQRKNLFLKRQQNFYPNNIIQRLCKHLTFEREYQNYLKVKETSVSTYNLVYFESRKIAGQRKAIYVAEGLDNFTSLASLVPIWKENGWPPFEERKRILDTLCEHVRQMHQRGILHNALSPRHLFFNIPLDQPYDIPEKIEVKLIDFERLKEIKPGSRKAITRDLFSMHRRCVGWPDKDRIWFLKQYLGINKLDDQARTIISNFSQKLLQNQQSRN